MAQSAVVEKIRIPHLFTPRTYQHSLMGFLSAGYRRYSGVWHRRAGKDKTAINLVVSQMVQHVGAYYYFFPTYQQAKKVIWDGIDPRTGMKYLDHFPKHLQAKEPNNTDLKITFTNGSFFQLVGTDSFNSIMGTNPIGCVFSEFSLQDPRAWDYIRPILRENGGWAAFIFTFRGKNHGWELHRRAETDPLWYAETLTVRDTRRDDGSPVITEADIEQDRKEGMDEALIEQEYYCSPEGYQLGAYYAKQLKKAREDKRICVVPHATGHEVYTFWDLGVDDSTTIWFMQAIGKELRFIDYYENSGEGFNHYAKVLKEKPYVYGDHYMPHDVEQRKLGAEVFSVRTVAENLGIKPIITVARARDTQAVLGGIEAGRNIISQCWFDDVKCSRGLMALEGYHAEYDEVKKKLDNKPAHDWTSHGADAFRTFAVGYAEKAKAEVSHAPHKSVWI